MSRNRHSVERTGSAPPHLTGLLRDFTAALGQQMYFWGRDVVHGSGNLLCAAGFDRRPSPGLEGTSCYRLRYEGGVIELHGACVGFYPGVERDAATAHGFLFIRNRARCFAYLGGEPPAPGLYEDDLLEPGPADEIYRRSLPFLDWWLSYEATIAEWTSPDYRNACRRAFDSLPRSRPWLPPAEAIRWLRAYRKRPATLRRAREWKKTKTKIKTKTPTPRR